MGSAAGARRGQTPLEVVPGGPGTRQLILRAAQQLFDVQGYDATSLRQIADAVGLTKAAVYYHYPAKEHLLLELIRPMIDAMSDVVTTMRNAQVSDPTVTLAAYLDVLLQHLPVVHLLARDPATQNHPDVGQRARSLVDAVQHLIAGPEATTEQTVRAACALGVAHAIATLPPDVASNNRDTILAAAAATLQPS